MPKVEINSLTEPTETTVVDENHRPIIERIIGGDLNAMLHNLDLCIQEEAGIDPDYEAYWADRESEQKDIDPDRDYEAEWDEWVGYS